MPRFTAAVVAFAQIALLASVAGAQQPRAIDYTVHVDSADLATFEIEMRLHNAPPAFTLAAAAHPEYDDKYWRYLENLEVQDARGRAGSVVRTDSMLWRVTNAGPGDVVVRYRIRPPVAPPLRAAWRSFLTPTGGVTGGPYSFLYVLGAERAHATVTLDLPAGWRVATALRATARPMVFTASDIDALMDSPILIGQMHTWRFTVRGVPHRVAYLRSAKTIAFDSVTFVNGIERYANQVAALFGAIPYGEYAFLFEDDAFGGGLEHVNSVTMGAPSAELAQHPYAVMPEIAHEFFHTWNLMRIRPVEYRGVDYRTQPPVAGLWFSEGLTMFYADLLLRRAGLPAGDSTRIAHLEYLVRSYVGNAGNSAFSAEQVSRVAYNSEPGVLGDYSPSTHLQGEIIGNMLDFVIRDATKGARSMDDVMRLMLERFSQRGFEGRDVERAVSDVCSCRVHEFFESYVRNAGAIDFGHYLALLGLRAEITRAPALASDGKPLADMRIRGYQPEHHEGLRLMLWNPASIWVRAGFHSGDRVVSMNGKPVTTWPEMRSIIGPLAIGDTLHVEVLRPAGPFAATVRIAGYDTPTVHIFEDPAATPEQKKLRTAWMEGQ